MNDTALLAEIEPNIEQAYAEHMQSIGDKRPFDPIAKLAAVAKTDVDPLAYNPVLREAHQQHLEAIEAEFGVDVRSLLAATFLVNLLTEDNLPHYTSRIHSKITDSPALTAFANEWTAEEDTHGVLMRDYALATGIIGSGDLALIHHADYHAGRVSQLRSGTEIDPPNLANAFAYLTLQEHLTKEAHNKLGWLLHKTGKTVLAPISGDEQNHYEFYQKLAATTLEVDPDTALTEMEQVYTNFVMPGKLGIPDFDDKAVTIGISGVFDLETIAQSKRTITQKIGIEDASPVSDEGKRAQEKILQQTTEKAVARQHSFMERLRDGQPTVIENGLAPFILGKTIDFERIETATGPRIVGLQAVAA